MTEQTSPTEPAPAPAPDRTAVIVLAVLVAAALLILAIGVPVAVGQLREEPPTLAAVQVFEDLRTDHREGEIEYPQTPPAGGPHRPAWLDCGVYDEPVPDENAVHDLEHGTVWITHDPDLAPGELERLAEQLPQNGIMSPYPGLDAPAVVTVWGRQLALDGADDPRLALFLEAFGAGETAPEPTASCAGGLQPDEAEQLAGTGTDPDQVAT